MAEYTKNYNLEKQQESDYVNVKGINDNFDVIDEELKSTAEKVDQAFLSASNGKQVIKTAIAGKDPSVTIPTEATFAQLAEAIGQIETGVDTEDATATAEQILSGMTAYVKGAKITGTIQKRIVDAYGNSPVTTSFHTHGDTYSEANGSNTFMLVPKGYYDGNTWLGISMPDLKPSNIKAGITIGTDIEKITGKSTVVDTEDAVLDPGYLVQGYSGYDDGVKKVGTMINRSAENHHQPAVSSTVSDANGYGAYVVPPAGYYNGSSWVRSLQPDLLSANILQGKNIFGIVGSAVQGKRWARGASEVSNAIKSFQYVKPRTTSEGTFSYFSSRYITVSGLNFTPSFVLISYQNRSSLDEQKITIYDTLNNRFHPNVFIVLTITANYISGAYTYCVKSDAESAYVNSTGFLAPTSTDIGVQATWIAYE